MPGDVDANSLSGEDFRKLFERGTGGVPKTESGHTSSSEKLEKKKTKGKSKKGGEEDIYRGLAEEDEKAGKGAEVEKNEDEKEISTADLDLVKELQAVQQTIKKENEIPEGSDLDVWHEENVRQLVEENEKIKERVRVANPRYQKARLHYLGHRFNLIHPDETGLLVAEDNDDFNVGRLRLIEDLLRITNGEGDLREVKDRLIAVGVYVKDLDNLSETVKPLFQKREEFLQKFYDEGSKAELELLEKEIGDIFEVEIMYERIKRGERAHPKKELEKKASDGVLEEVKENSSGYFYSDLLFDDLYLLEFGSEDEKKEAKIRLEKEGVKIKDNETTYDYTFMVMALEDIKKRDFKRWSKDPQKAKSFVRRMLFLEKKPEGESENKGIEPQYYDELYLDLWNAEYGDGDEKKQSQERLISNNILLVDFGADDVAKETYRMALEAIRNNKFVAWHDKKELAEAHIKKIHGIKESVASDKKEGVEANVDREIDEEREKYLEYLGEEFLEDLRKAYPEMQGNKPKGLEWSEVDEAAKKLKNKGFSEFITKKDNRDRRDFRSGRRFRERLNNYLAGKPIDEENVFFDQVKVLKIEMVDLEEARKRKQEKNNKEKGKNGESKMNKKEKLAALVREDLDGEDLKKFYRAINVIVENNAIGSEFKTVDEAREFFASNIKVGLKKEGGGEPEEPGESKDKMKENGEINEEEKWNKVSDLLANLETARGDERIALYLEIEQCGVRIRGTISDLIEAGAGEEEIKKSFKHMANMAKVWQMGEDKAKREYPKMVEKYASMARLLRLKWYN